MTPELGLFLLKIILIFNSLAYNNSVAKSTLIRNGKQYELIDTSITEATINSISTKQPPILLPPTIQSQTTITDFPLTSSFEAKPTTTEIIEDITKPPFAQTQQSQLQQSQSLHQQQQINPWHLVWNSAQSIWPIITPNWWSYGSNQQQQLVPIMSSHIQATPVASLTLTFGKRTIHKKESVGNNVSSSVNENCPPPIVISGVCPEAKCNCQCDNQKKNPKPIPVIQKNEKLSTSSLSSLISSTTPSVSVKVSTIAQTKQQSKQYQQHRQEPIKFLPFQSWQDFFLKPVQMISSRGGSTSITSSEGDQNNIEQIKNKQSPKLIPQSGGFSFWY